MSENAETPEEKDPLINKTPEQLLREKKAAFEKDPDSFVSVEELIVATRKHPSGAIETLIGQASRGHLEISVMRIMSGVTDRINHMKILAAQKMEEEKKIVTPNNGVLNFARTKK